MKRFLLSLAFTLPTLSLLAAGRPWTVDDSVAVRYFRPDLGTRAAQYGNGMGNGYVADRRLDAERAILYAPDLRHFALLTYRGDLAGNAVVSEIHVYETAAVERAVRDRAPAIAPVQTISLRSSRSVCTLSQPNAVRWANDHTLSFVAAEGDAGAQVCLFDLLTSTLRRVAPPVADEWGVAGYDSNGETVALTWYEKRRDTASAFDGARVDLLLGDRAVTDLTKRATQFISHLYVAAPGQAPRELLSRPQPSFGNDPFPEFLVSPDGSHLLIRTVKLDGSTKKLAAQFELLDLTATSAPRVIGDCTETGWKSFQEEAWAAGWTADSRHFVTTALLDAESGQARRRYLASYDLASGRWTRLAPFEKTAEVLWRRDGRQCLLVDDPKTAAAGKRFTLEDGTWREHPATAAEIAAWRQPAERRLHLEAREDLNTPPNVYAVEASHSVPLLPPDPTLAGVAWTSVEVFEWKVDGETVQGLLMLPKTESTAPLPLVVQTTLLHLDQFLPDGGAVGPFAAQTFAAQGYAVLQIRTHYPQLVPFLDAAVAKLSRERGIDANRVGLVGFSNTGGQSFLAITHPGQVKVAAAVAADNWMMNFTDLLRHAGTSRADPRGGYWEWNFTQMFKTPFWQDKARWLELEPTFNLERCVTPMLFATHGGAGEWVMGDSMHSIGYVIDVAGAFALTGRPVEFLFLPHAKDHQLQNPQQRQAEMQATVDWLNFWILGRENPTKPDQNAAWRKKKSAWAAQQAWETAGNPAGSKPKPAAPAQP